MEWQDRKNGVKICLTQSNLQVGELLADQPSPTSVGARKEAPHGAYIRSLKEMVYIHPKIFSSSFVYFLVFFVRLFSPSI